MQAVADMRDKRGYWPVHLAFETRSWAEIKRAVDGGANITVLTPSGASLEEFAEGLGLSDLFRQLEDYRAKKS